MKMTCQQTRDSLGDHSVGLLDAHALAAFEAHVAACSACASEARQFSRLVVMLDHAPSPTPPKDLWMGIRARVELEKSVAGYARGAQTPPARGRWSSALAAVAGFACAAVIMASLSTQGGRFSPAGAVMAAAPPVAVSMSRHNAMESTSPVADGSSIVAVDAVTVTPLTDAPSLPAPSFAGGAVR
ncbi:MAG TPA: hypothetical protein VGM37_04380 [Armatimonadota bacterium]|jgi:anti-sigma factor RsiW